MNKIKTFMTVLVILLTSSVFVSNVTAKTSDDTISFVYKIAPVTNQSRQPRAIVLAFLLIHYP